MTGEKMAKCNLCNQTFNGAHGVSVHQRRNPDCANNPTKSHHTSKSNNGRRKYFSPYLGKNGETGKEAIRDILSNYPDGLSNMNVRKELKERGFDIHNSTYVSQVTAKDNKVVRVSKGVYRLKKNSYKSSAPKSLINNKPSEPVTKELSREVLLLRIETLEAQNRALQDAHTSLMRGMLS